MNDTSPADDDDDDLDHVHIKDDHARVMTKQIEFSRIFWPKTFFFLHPKNEKVQISFTAYLQWRKALFVAILDDI